MFNSEFSLKKHKILWDFILELFYFLESLQRRIYNFIKEILFFKRFNDLEFLKLQL